MAKARIVAACRDAGQRAVRSRVRQAFELLLDRETPTAVPRNQRTSSPPAHEVPMRIVPTALLSLALSSSIPALQVVPVTRDDWTPELLDAAYTEAGADAWLDGELVTLRHGSELGEGVLALIGGDLHPMQHVGDVWTASFRVEDPDTVLLSYGFYTAEGNGYRNLSPEPRTFRGPRAPEPPPRSEELAGTFFKLPFQSVVLGETRELTVYLPPGYVSGETYPVVYMTDGGGRSYASYLDALVQSGELRPTILIGLPPGKRRPGDAPELDRRANEYLVGADDEAFGLHEEFFVYEVRTLIEDRYGAARERELRAVAGYSNGAAFALSAARRNPHAYGHVIALSFGWQPEAAEWERVEAEDAPRVQLACGRLEPSFRKTTVALHERLVGRGLSVEFTERNSGHDAAMWHEELAHAVRRAFPRSF